MTLIKEAVIPKEAHGQRLDVALATLFPEYSRSQLQHWLKQGSITLNERSCPAKEKVLGQENVRLIIPTPMSHDTHEAEPIPLNIIYEDEDLLVINKPAGLVVHPGAGNKNHTLINALLYHNPSLSHLPRAGIVHRLDKDTTGLLIVAKTLIAHTQLIRQMQARDIHRHYITLVYGHVISGGLIDTYYSRHPRHRLKMAVATHGRQAITEFSLRKQYQYATLLDVTLMTGRTHQIRVHMAHINHPVVGDALYGGRARLPLGLTEPLRQALQSFKRQALHAHQLLFSHPITQEPLTLVAPLPDDFQSLLTALDHHASSVPDC